MIFNFVVSDLQKAQLKEKIIDNNLIFQDEQIY